MFNSIKGRLVTWIFVFISLLLTAVGASLHMKVHDAIFTSIDNSLDSKITIVAGLLHFEEGKIEFELSEFVSGEYSIPRSGRYYKVVMDGRVFAASPSLMDDDYDFTLTQSDMRGGTSGDSAYTSAGPGGERVRVMQHDFEFMGMPVTVFLAESIEEDLAAIGRIRNFLLLSIPVSIIITGMISLWIVKRSLRPLHLFSGAVSRITHKNLNERVDSGKHTAELSRLAGSFNAMLDRLQRAFEVEKRIISDASHELKTPLSVIKTQCDVVLQRSRTAAEYIEAIETIKYAGDNMSGLVHNLLSLARLDSGLLSSSEFTDVSLSDCLQRALSVVKVLAGKSGVRIRSDFGNGVNVFGADERLIEAFTNIIENAVRYNRPGGSVDIQVSAGDAYAEIMISDTGQGIEEKHLDRIFERFYRADRARSTGGTGLGLSIAKTIINAHGGEIRAESEAGKGSLFIVSLPLISGNETVV